MVSVRYVVKKSPSIPSVTSTIKGWDDGTRGFDVVDTETGLKFGLWWESTADKFAEMFNSGVVPDYVTWSEDGNDADDGRHNHGT